MQKPKKRKTNCYDRHTIFEKFVEKERPLLATKHDKARNPKRQKTSANRWTASGRKRAILPAQKNVKAPSQFATHFQIFTKFRSDRKSTHDSAQNVERQSKNANSTKCAKPTLQVRQNLTNRSTASCRKRAILPAQKNVKAPSQLRLTSIFLQRPVCVASRHTTLRHASSGKQENASSTKFDKPSLQIRQNSAKGYVRHTIFEKLPYFSKSSHLCKNSPRPAAHAQNRQSKTLL